MLGILTGWVTAPVRGVLALGRVIQQRVEQEMYDPASIRRDLEAAEEARAAGEITAEQEQAIQRQGVQRMTRGNHPPDTAEE